MVEITPLLSPNRSRVEPLWRHVLGRQLRALRERQGRTLSDVAEQAAVSPQYLSEIERGLKEPSSEMIAAVAGALGATLVDLSSQVTDELVADGLRRQRVLDLAGERDLAARHSRADATAPLRGGADRGIRSSESGAMLLAA